MVASGRGGARQRPMHGSATRAPAAAPEDGRRRVVIEKVAPEIDCGRYPIKRTPGERVRVTATAIADGHDVVAAVLRWKPENARTWREIRMDALPNDAFEAEFTVPGLGACRYTVSAWIDRFATWRRDLEKKVEAGQEVSVELLAGAELAEAAARRADGFDRQKLEQWANVLRSAAEGSLRVMPDQELSRLMDVHAERAFLVEYSRELTVMVDRERARFGAWYEMFPRSASAEPGRHGTFADVVERLPYIAGMGFDVLYLPPIHPIGRTYRKGKNNSVDCAPGDPGSPWAIGDEDGGHTAIHPDLGTFEEFDELLARARDHGLEIALDIAFQCSPDHPYVKEHPEWFRKRPDGSIQYAENPPKRYQDIYPLDFETADWRALWSELRDVVVFWADRGVRIFRVDNPHTKAFRFWEWMIAGVRARFPDVIFLSEAFTRPAVVYHLAKLGFDQSYTYFTWRMTKHELMEYFTELTRTDVAEYFRPNLWPNTPDILPEHLQIGARPAFMHRLVLAATLGTNYGIYGPAYELMEHEPIAQGKEEYFNSEKYEIRSRQLDDEGSLADFIALVNVIRRDNPALHSYDELRFVDVDNDMLLAYVRATRDRSNVLLVVVNLDLRWRQSGTLRVPLHDLGFDGERPYLAHDLLTGARYVWRGEHNYVELDPWSVPAHILRLEHGPRDERASEAFG